MLPSSLASSPSDLEWTQGNNACFSRTYCLVINLHLRAVWVLVVAGRRGVQRKEGRENKQKKCGRREEETKMSGQS